MTQSKHQDKHSRWLLGAACATLFFTSACTPESGSPDEQDGAPETASSALRTPDVSFNPVPGHHGVGAQNSGGGEFIVPTTSAQARTLPRTRVVGYLPNRYGTYASWVGRVDFDKLSHVFLAFVRTDANGQLTLAPSSDLATFVNAAHAKGVKVFPSIGGAAGSPAIAPYYQPGKVDAFVDRIIDFAVSNNMDGIDVDVEAPELMGAAYDTFIAKLIAKARPRGLPVTAAVAQWMQYGMSDTTLRSFDFITIMAYDKTGTWTGPGEHSTYAQAQSALAFYTGKGLSKDKIVLGVPFYGYCWGDCGVENQDSTSVLYKNILARYPDAWNADWIDAGGAQYSYNGLVTMRAKAALATQYGGIMIWELAGDPGTSSEYSLLRAIDDVLNQDAPLSAPR